MQFCCHILRGRRRLSWVLVLLWSFYVFHGTAALCQAVPTPPNVPKTASSPQTAPVQQCHMKNCPMMHGGKCCCHPSGSSTPTSKAVFCACCDHGAPAVLVAAVSWPVTLPDPALCIAPRHLAPQLGQAVSQSAVSLQVSPELPPPCLR